MEKQRYRLLSDNDGHEYTIPTELVDEFYEWLDTVEDSDEIDKYDEYRVEGLLSFTDPRRE